MNNALKGLVGKLAEHRMTAHVLGSRARLHEALASASKRVAVEP